MGREGTKDQIFPGWMGQNLLPQGQGVLGVRDPEFMSEIQGSKIWWRWCNHNLEPWVRLWHVKYSRDKTSAHLIRYNEESLGYHIWMKAQSG